MILSGVTLYNSLQKLFVNANDKNFTSLLFVGLGFVQKCIPGNYFITRNAVHYSLHPPNYVTMNNTVWELVDLSPVEIVC